MASDIVSIIVPCYKQAEFLSETLNSVLAQTNDNWECVIINDGSPDNTEEIALNYCNKDSRFKYVYKENGGLSSARNFGIAHSIGEYILPLDADDLIGEEYVDEIIKHFSTSPETTLIACRGEKFGASNGSCVFPTYSYETLIHMNCFVCTSAFKRIDYDRIGGYDPDMKHGMEDWNFWLSLLTPQSIVHTIDKVLFYYRQKEESMYTQMKPYYEENLKKIAKNHPYIYEQYWDEILWLWFSNNELTTEINGLKSTLPYKIGLIILKPYRMIKSIIKRYV
ncbi:glycosyltransferase family 2 protein [Pseudobutyrivibrio sp.]|uniref:glycosyltransferase family 2 protein n=1 Tax=Pseudobutyrivibrio sp. TaxID=2014367 RepID=UPI0038681EBE